MRECTRGYRCQGENIFFSKRYLVSRLCIKIHDDALLFNATRMRTGRPVDAWCPAPPCLCCLPACPLVMVMRAQCTQVRHAVIRVVHTNVVYVSGTCDAALTLIHPRASTTITQQHSSTQYMPVTRQWCGPACAHPYRQSVGSHALWRLWRMPRTSVHPR